MHRNTSMYSGHARYLEGFIETLGLTNVTLVLHDWGSGLGFHYAHRHPDNVTAIAFMEAILKPAEWSDANPVVRFIFKRMRDAVKENRMNMDKNFFIKRLLPVMTRRRLTAAERNAVPRSSFTQADSGLASRDPVCWRWSGRRGRHCHWLRKVVALDWRSQIVASRQTGDSRRSSSQMDCW